MAISLRIVHLSDPHFGTVKPTAMKALLIAMKILSPHAVVISGDITHRARKKQFEEARIFANTFEGLPLLILPGNHDIPMYNIFARIFHPYSGYKKILAGTLNQEINLQHVQILALNSTRRSKSTQGVVDTSFLKAHLSTKQKPQIRIVVFHHPIECPSFIDEKNLLINRDEVVPVLSEHRVDLVLNGHIHNPITCLSHHRYPKISRSMIINVAGTCLSSRTRSEANNSFNVIDIQTDQKNPKLTISRYDLIDEVEFEAVESQRFIRSSEKGWEKN